MKKFCIATLVLALAGCATSGHSTENATASNHSLQSNVESSSRFEVVPLKYALAGEVAQSIEQALAVSSMPESDRICVVADVRTNSLIVCCPADKANELPNLLAAIAHLDREVTKK